MAFPRQLHAILSGGNGRICAENILSWEPDGKSFVIHDRQKLVETILPTCFRISKWASFQRQLNLYGFQHTPTVHDQSVICYYHEFFQRDNVSLINRIQRTAIKGSRPRQSKPQYKLTSSTTVTPKLKQLTQDVRGPSNDITLDINKNSNPALTDHPESIQGVQTTYDHSAECAGLGRPFAYVNQENDNHDLHQIIVTNQVTPHHRPTMNFNPNMLLENVTNNSLQLCNQNHINRSHLISAVALLSAQNEQRSHFSLLHSQMQDSLDSMGWIPIHSTTTPFLQGLGSGNLLQVDNKALTPHLHPSNWLNVNANSGRNYNSSQLLYLAEKLPQLTRCHNGPSNERIQSQIIENQLLQHFQRDHVHMSRLNVALSCQNKIEQLLMNILNDQNH